MPTPSQIDEQVQFERDAIKQGLKRLRENTKRLEESNYASASVYGISSIDTLLPLVTERIRSTTEYKLNRAQGHEFKLVKEYVSQVEPLAAAAIALKVTFDKVFSAIDDSNKLQNVVGAIGSSIEQECQIFLYHTLILLSH